MKHLIYVPFTGLGLYGGFRGNRWLKNRIQVFEQFVVTSLKAQTVQNWVLWVGWRPEERTNPRVIALRDRLEEVFPGRVCFTFHGLCFWDDKYPDDKARDRLASALHGSTGDLIDHLDSSEVLMTIQPSDDCYTIDTFEKVQKFFTLRPEYQAIGYSRGYIVNHKTLEVAEYNPATSPPFYTIKFPKQTFIDPWKHMQYTGPYKSHEYVPQFLKMHHWPDWRGFLVGTHTENVSTHFNHPYKGAAAPEGVLAAFGLDAVEPLTISWSWRKRVLRMLPHRVQRKLRYWFGECIYAKLYEYLRN